MGGMNEPKRIQRKRTKGWRMPEGAVYVGRPTKWGNPWTPDMCGGAREAVRGYALLLAHDPYGDGLAESARFELAGKNLACWCPLDQPCHADVLLEIANEDTECHGGERCANCTQGDVHCDDGCPTCDDWYATAPTLYDPAARPDATWGNK